MIIIVTVYSCQQEKLVYHVEQRENSRESLSVDLTVNVFYPPERLAMRELNGNIDWVEKSEKEIIVGLCQEFYRLGWMTGEDLKTILS